MSVFGPVWENPQSWKPTGAGTSGKTWAGGRRHLLGHGVPEAEADLRWSLLAGKKLLIRGNHDYWWSSISKVRRSLPRAYMPCRTIISAGDWIICGTRGWPAREEGLPSPETRRLRRKFSAFPESAARRGKGLLVALHYPPFSRPQLPSGFTELMEQHGVQACVYGHIHNTEPEGVFQGNLRGIDYYFVAADGVNFTPVLIRE